MNFTDKAISYIKGIMPPNSQLKISVVGGGCSGLSYKMEWIDKDQTIGHHFVQEGLHYCVDAKSWLFIKDVEVDHSDGLNGTGFSYSNPSAARTCGCGTSFSNSD